jgi:predicted nicotinamide N-methyase
VEFGSGCGLVGIATAALGAKSVVMTDLPYTLSLMEENVRRNADLIDSNTIQSRPCDWFDPPEFDESWEADVVLLTDCVWVAELVPPLLKTLEAFVGSQKKDKRKQSITVVVSYQRRGKVAHELFWDGMKRIFASIQEEDLPRMGLVKPDVLGIWKCR